MVSKEDWSAVMSSEVFREYLGAELQRKAAVSPEPKVEEKPSKEEVMDKLAEMEGTIKSNPQMLQVFSALRQKFLTDPDYAAQVDPLFVEGVLMLDLDQE